MTNDTSLRIAEGLADVMRAAHPGWTHEPVPGTVVPAVVSDQLAHVACPICHRLHDGDDCGGSYLASQRSEVGS